MRDLETSGESLVSGELKRERSPFSGWLVFIIGLLLALPFALNLALGNSLGRDEHQHLAAGIVILREGWLPYRDFAFFHLPYLPWTYAGLFAFFGDPLLLSRLFSAICVAATAGLVGVGGWHLWGRGRGWALAAGGAGIAILLTVPLFAQVAGHSWNMEPSTLLMLAAFVLLLEKRGVWGWGLAGILMGLAVGYRITVAPMVLPLMIMAWRQERSWRPILFYAGGVSAAMLPVAVAFLMSPAEFFFGNVEFPKVNIDYRYATGEPRTMTILHKLRFFFKEVMRPNWPLLIGLPTLLLVAWGWAKVRFWNDATLKSIALALPFLMLGALAPSPSFDQYYYVLIPFLILALLALLKLTTATAATLHGRAILAGAIVIFTGFATFWFDEYESFRRMTVPEKWAVTEAQEEAEELRSVLGASGRLLTVVPGFALEGGFEIYPEFVTGPFAWRVSPYVAADRRPQLHLTTPEELEIILAAKPPVGILTGYAKKEEKPLVAYARAHTYDRKKLRSGKTLWLPPRASEAN